MKRKLSLVVLMAALCGTFLTGCDNDSKTPAPPAGTNTPTPTPPSTNAPPK